MSSEVDPLRVESLGRRLKARGQVRVDQTALWADFSESFPHRPQAEERAWLLAALELLAANDVVRLPSTRGNRWDRTLSPFIPRSIDIVRAQEERPRAWRNRAWHPRLAWLNDVKTLTQRQEEFLGRLDQAFIDGSLADRVPLKYRSLQLTGSEKELEDHLASKLFGPARLHLDDLNCDRETLPLAWHNVGPSPHALIFENAGPYHVARTVLANQPSPPYGIIAYGGGDRIERSISYLGMIGRPIESLHYIGDLDLDGLQAARRAREAAQEAKLPPLQPATAIHRLMLDQRITFGRPDGWPHRQRNANPKDLKAAAEFVDSQIRTEVFEMLHRGNRVPEEVLGPRELGHVWASQSASRMPMP